MLKKSSPLKQNALIDNPDTTDVWEGEKGTPEHKDWLKKKKAFRFAADVEIYADLNGCWEAPDPSHRLISPNLNAKGKLAL